MAEVFHHDGGYRFLRGVFPYSAGVAADPGFEIERARFAQPVALDEGFRRIRAHLASRGRPATAFCGCELRSPRPFTEAGFAEFNRRYVAVLGDWGLFREDLNPVARSNVCPESGAPPEPSFYAFTYTIEGAGGSRPSFQIAGCGEVPEGRGNYRDHIVRRGDVSSEGLREKALWVLGEQERRLDALKLRWSDVTAVHVYTVHDGILRFVAEELTRRGAPGGGIAWQVTRPPVVEIEFEMDCRGVFRESVL